MNDGLVGVASTKERMSGHQDWPSTVAGPSVKPPPGQLVRRERTRVLSALKAEEASQDGWELADAVNPRRQ